MSKVGAKYQIRKNRVLRTLLDNRDQLSLTDLTKRTGLSLPMVSRVVASLGRERLVRTSQERSSVRVGRPPIMARLNGEGGYVLGIDLGHLNTNIVLLNLRQEVVEEIHHRSFPLGNDARILDALTAEIPRVLRKASVGYDRLLGVGLSIPGLVRGREGRSVTYLNFGEATVRDLLRARWKKPVVIEHDAKAMARGERWFGAARGLKNALCLNLGWGLGLGIILEGRIYYGRDGFAGEFGHGAVAGTGRLCQCGKRGCLETVASGRAIAEAARERLERGETSILGTSLAGKSARIEAERVVQAAVGGDQFSMEVLESAGRALGEGVAKLINLFNPEAVIFGGRVAAAGEFLLGPARTTALQQSHPDLNRGVSFVLSTLGPSAGALGVAMQVAEDLFEVEHLNPSAYV